MPFKRWLLLALLPAAALAQRHPSARQLFLECQRTVESADRLHVEFTTSRRPDRDLPQDVRGGSLWLDGACMRLQSTNGQLWILNGQKSWKSPFAPDVEGFRSTPGRVRHLLVSNGVLALLQPAGGIPLSQPSGFGSVDPEKGRFWVNLLLPFGTSTIRETLFIDGTTHLPASRTFHGPSSRKNAFPYGTWTEQYSRFALPGNLDRHLFDIPPARLRHP